MKTGLRTLLSTLVIGLAVGATSIASAQDEDVGGGGGGGGGGGTLRPGTKPLAASFGLGPAIGVNNFAGTQLKLSQEIIYHLNGNASGFGIGAVLQESFGGGGVVFQLGGKATFDIGIVPGKAVYIAPYAQLGFAASTGAGNSFAFNMQFGADLKLILEDAYLIYVRPLAFDLALAEFVGVHYDLIFGAGYTF